MGSDRSSPSRWLLRLAVALSLAHAPARAEDADAAQGAPAPDARLALAVAVPRSFVTVDDVDVAVHDTDPSGRLPTIVCLHAIGQGGGDFAAFAAAFRDRFRIVTVDWPGHGASGQDHVPASAERYAGLLRGVLDALKVEKAIVFGNSIGGAAAIALAQRSPERVAALVLCNPGGLDPGGFVADLFIRHLARRFERGGRGDPRYLDWYEAYYDRILLGEVVSARRREIVAAGYETAPRLTEAWTSFSAPESDLRAGVPSLRMPVFVGWAMRDRLVQWGRNRRAVLAFPDVTVHPFADAGHAPFLEAPEEFNAAVAPFLARVSADL